MLAIAAVGVIIAILLRTSGEMVRACLIAGLWALPLAPVLVTWALIDRLIIVSDRGAAAALSLLAGIVVAGSAATLFSWLVFARQVPWRVALLGIGMAFGLVDIALAFIVDAVS